MIRGFLVLECYGSIKFEVSPCMANWNLASRREKARASLGGKPSQEEEGPTESFKELIVDKVNKENFNRSIDLFSL